MEKNVELARQVVRYVLDHPESYNQDEWFDDANVWYAINDAADDQIPVSQVPVPKCGTACCLAGRAVLLADRFTDVIKRYADGRTTMVQSDAWVRVAADALGVELGTEGGALLYRIFRMTSSDAYDADTDEFEFESSALYRFAELFGVQDEFDRTDES